MGYCRSRTITRTIGSLFLVSPIRSALLNCVSRRGTTDQKPPITSNELDTAAMTLLKRWIAERLPDQPTYPECQVAHFESSNDSRAVPDEDPDLDGALNHREFLTGSDPWDKEDFWRSRIEQNAGKIEVNFHRKANIGFNVQRTDSVKPPVNWTSVGSMENR